MRVIEIKIIDNKAHFIEFEKGKKALKGGEMNLVLLRDWIRIKTELYNKLLIVIEK